MAIPGRPPKATKIGKPKIMLSGLPGVGKTWLAMDFPNVFYIDTEGGGELAHYQEKLEKAGGRYFGREDGSQDFATVIATIQWLATNQHPYKTLSIDSFTKLYLTEAAKAEEKVGNEFGKDRKEANRPTRRMMSRLEHIDMSVILVCHAKDKWKGGELVGTGFDGFEKMEYDLHLWLEAVKRGKDRFAQVRKSRLLGFQENELFPLSYTEFAKRYGVDILEADTVPVPVASPEQVAELERLVKVMNIPLETTEKWLEKAGCERFAEFPADAATKCIAWMLKQVQPASPAPADDNGKPAKPAKGTAAAAVGATS